MRKYTLLQIIEIVCIVVYSQAQEQNQIQKIQLLSSTYSQLTKNLDLLEKQSIKIANITQVTNEYTLALNDIQKNIMNISIQTSDDGGFFGDLFGSSDSNEQTEAAFNELKTSLAELTKQINNVFTRILNQINLIKKNSAMRNIDSSVTLLKSLSEAYTLNSPDDHWIFQQLCGDYLNQCNKAFIVLAEALSDYISEVQITSGQNITEILTQYTIYNSLLITSTPILIHLNTKAVIFLEKLDPKTLNSIQRKQYSLSSLLIKTYQRSNQKIYSIVPELYETFQFNLTIQKNSFIELSPIDKPFLKGIKVVGISVQQITESEVCLKGILPSSYLIKSEKINFDNNDTSHYCPINSFLRGFLLSDGFDLHNIDELVCNTYQNQYHKDCHELDISGYQQTTQWAKCDGNSFIAGFFRGGGDHMNYITKLYCCSITSERPEDLAYLDNLKIVKTSYNSTQINVGTVDYTGGIKGLVQFFTINNILLEGNFEVGVRIDIPVSEAFPVDVKNVFKKSFGEGKCSQDSFLWGFDQGTGSLLSDIITLQCAKYVNIYWNICTSKVFPSDENYWRCISGNCDTPKNIPKAARCEGGSYLVGFQRNKINNMSGLDKIICCTTTDQPGLFLP